MSNNDQIILDKTLEQQRTERAPHLTADKYFQLFSAEQLLKHFDLSYEEIESGIVDEGGDGGIDGFFVFVNGELVREDTDLNGLKKDVVIRRIGELPNDWAVLRLTDYTTKWIVSGSPTIHQVNRAIRDS